MMLDWLGAKHSDQALIDGARSIEHAVELAFVQGQVKPFEFGGQSGTIQVTEAVLGHLKSHAQVGVPA